MKSKSETRNYQMTLRSETAAQRGRIILEEALELMRKHPVDEITLEQIAGKSDVAVRTVLRKFGSKEGVFRAIFEEDIAGIFAARSHAKPGEIDQALKILLENYELIGDLNMRVLAVENKYPVFKKLLKEGRQYHRAWCANVFSPYLPSRKGKRYERRLLAFIAATEIYLWKVLRKDLNKSYQETLETYQHLVGGLIIKYRKPDNHE